MKLQSYVSHQRFHIEAKDSHCEIPVQELPALDISEKWFLYHTTLLSHLGMFVTTGCSSRRQFVATAVTSKS